MNDDDAAMKAVLEDMGNAARAFKKKKYEPKPEPVAEQPDAQAEGAPEVAAHELEALLNGG